MPQTLFIDREKPSAFGEGIRAERIKKHIKKNKEIREKRAAKKEARRKGRRASGNPIRKKAYEER